MVSRKYINIYIPKYFMAVRKYTNIYIPKYFCTFRGSFDEWWNEFRRASWGAKNCSIQYYYIIVPCCTTTRSNIIKL